MLHGNEVVLGINQVDSLKDCIRTPLYVVKRMIKMMVENFSSWLSIDVDLLDKVVIIKFWILYFLAYYNRYSNRIIKLNYQKNYK